MARGDDDRNFALRSDTGEETSVYSGRTPRQAALKAARDLENPAASEAEAEEQEIRLREKGTKKVHIYDAWNWKESPPEVDPDQWEDDEPWMANLNEITEANVSKKGIEHLEEI